MKKCVKTTAHSLLILQQGMKQTVSKKKLSTSLESLELSPTKVENKNLFNSNLVDLVTSSEEEQIEVASVNPQKNFTISLSEYSSKLNILMVVIDNI